MKSLISACIVLLFVSPPSPGATHTITNSGFTFTPNSLTVEAGDTIVFSLESIHNAVEVSQSTWNGNGQTALPGGFAVGFGGGTVILTAPGDHYYVCQPHAGAGMKGTITVTPVTGVRQAGNIVPEMFRLGQNYPNPFNPSTTIEFSVAGESYTDVSVYDVTGRFMQRLTGGTLSPGTYAASWDGNDPDGRPAGSGVYFIRMSARGEAGDFTFTRKLLLLR